jgi:hypothetical protein
MCCSESLRETIETIRYISMTLPLRAIHKANTGDARFIS